MKKTVLTFGLIISVRMVGSLFLLIYFGIRSYRDNTVAGQISFGRAFACGILSALIDSLCDVTGSDVVILSDDFAGMERKSYFRVTRLSYPIISDPARST